MSTVQYVHFEILNTVRIFGRVTMKCFLVIVLMALLALEVRGSAYVDVHASVFKNDYGLDQNENKCESIWHIFGEYCDHKFTFCLLDGDSCSTTFHTGTYWDTFLVNFGNPMAGGDANPMKFHFHDYLGWFTLKVVVIDDDNGLTDDDPVDTFIVHQTLSSTSPTRKTTFTGQRQTKPTTLDLSFTVQCDPNFYGARCSVYCQDTNSESGHYTCGSSGERVCLEGWTNPVQHCLTAICSRGCAHGYCNSPNQCICRAGYSGPLCTQAICDGSQLTKKCIRPPCSYIFCQNNGTCTDSEGFGVCTCPPGFSGLYCESTPSDDPPENDGEDQFSAMVYILIGISIGLITSLVWVYLLFWRISKCPTSPMSGKTIWRYCEKVKNYFKQGSRMKLSDKTSEEKNSLGQHEDLVIVVEDLSKVESGSQDRSQSQAVVWEDEDIQDCGKERLLMLEESKV